MDEDLPPRPTCNALKCFLRGVHASGQVTPGHRSGSAGRDPGDPAWYIGSWDAKSASWSQWGTLRDCFLMISSVLMSVTFSTGPLVVWPHAYLCPSETMLCVCHTPSVRLDGGGALTIVHQSLCPLAARGALHSAPATARSSSWDVGRSSQTMIQHPLMTVRHFLMMQRSLIMVNIVPSSRNVVQSGNALPSRGGTCACIVPSGNAVPPPGILHHRCTIMPRPRPPAMRAAARRPDRHAVVQRQHERGRRGATVARSNRCAATPSQSGAGRS